MPSQGKMSLPDFRRIFDLFSDCAAWVGLYNWGEPLLHPELFAMIGYVAGSHVRSIVSTHFSLPFSVQDAREMVRSGLSRLIVSVDGATAETYAVYRIGGDFSLVTENLRVLADTKRDLGSVTPEIVVQFIPFRHNEHESAALQALVRRWGAHLSVVPATCDMGSVIDMAPQEAVRRCGAWLPTGPTHRRYDTAGQWTHPVAVCESLWNTVVLRWDGEVYPCCLPYKDEHSLGNIHAVPFDSIWNGAQMQHARALFVHDATVNVASPAACDLCYANQGWNVQDLPPAGLYGIWSACRNALARRMSLWSEGLRR